MDGLLSRLRNHPKAHEKPPSNVNRKTHETDSSALSHSIFALSERRRLAVRRSLCLYFDSLCVREVILLKYMGTN